jgi:hypothetical protein
VARIDPAAVRTTVDVYILIDRSDLDRAKAALERVGFVHSFTFDIHIFVDGPQGNARERDRTHLRDMIDVGLVDARTAARLHGCRPSSGRGWRNCLPIPTVDAQPRAREADRAMTAGMSWSAHRGERSLAEHMPLVGLSLSRNTRSYASRRAEVRGRSTPAERRRNAGLLPRPAAAGRGRRRPIRNDSPR